MLPLWMRLRPQTAARPRLDMLVLRAQHDRDVNAATNIMVAAGLADTANACGPDMRPTQRHAGDADGNEAGTHRADHRAHAVAS